MSLKVSVLNNSIFEVSGRFLVNAISFLKDNCRFQSQVKTEQITIKLFSNPDINRDIMVVVLKNRKNRRL